MFVKLMADYCSTGVWHQSGTMMEMESLPISDKLKAEIKKWTDWYEGSEFYLDPSDRKGEFDIGAFNRQGALLAIKINNELPLWSVLYRPE